jgi:hypothetical protein
VLFRSGKDQAMNQWIAMLLFFAAVFAFIWLSGPPTPKPLLTGATCMEVADRLWKQRGKRSLTEADKIDLESCRGP